MCGCLTPSRSESFDHHARTSEILRKKVLGPLGFHVGGSLSGGQCWTLVHTQSVAAAAIQPVRQKRLCQVAAGMKLDVNALRYLSREEFRTLQAVEVGQKNVSILHGACFPARGGHKVYDVDLLVCKPPIMLRLCLQHDLVPTPLIDSIAGLKCAFCVLSACNPLPCSAVWAAALPWASALLQPETCMQGPWTAAVPTWLQQVKH